MSGMQATETAATPPWRRITNRLWPKAKTITSRAMLQSVARFALATKGTMGIRFAVPDFDWKVYVPFVANASLYNGASFVAHLKGNCNKLASR